MRPSGPSYAYPFDVTATVDTNYTELVLPATYLFQEACRFGVLCLWIESVTTATEVTLLITADEAGAQPLTNPALTGSTQEIGTSISGSVCSWNLDALIPSPEKTYHFWIKVDAGELANVSGSIAWQP